MPASQPGRLSNAWMKASVDPPERLLRLKHCRRTQYLLPQNYKTLDKETSSPKLATGILTNRFPSRKVSFKNRLRASTENSIECEPSRAITDATCFNNRWKN